ncbi:uncharacterized protein LOC118598880 isoform X2 [Oryzias melastigma]|uniref:uncharacterized protein LOC118598880 isoform X2 n=1 Tax=Oryzias melastigma TaxID=30732 RepID=UPI00168D3AC7|nr:uncharacterized protein LOC118598880 isoform X2 [Oryzias melastigma]
MQQLDRFCCRRNVGKVSRSAQHQVPEDPRLIQLRARALNLEQPQGLPARRQVTTHRPGSSGSGQFLTFNGARLGLLSSGHLRSRTTFSPDSGNCFCSVFSDNQSGRISVPAPEPPPPPPPPPVAMRHLQPPGGGRIPRTPGTRRSSTAQPVEQTGRSLAPSARILFFSFFVLFFFFLPRAWQAPELGWTPRALFLESLYRVGVPRFPRPACPGGLWRLSICGHSQCPASPGRGQGNPHLQPLRSQAKVVVPVRLPPFWNPTTVIGPSQSESLFRGTTVTNWE